jgi:hypothetical protein
MLDSVGDLGRGGLADGSLTAAGCAGGRPRPPVPRIPPGEVPVRPRPAGPVPHPHRRRPSRVGGPRRAARPAPGPRPPGRGQTDIAHSPGAAPDSRPRKAGPGRPSSQPPRQAQVMIMGRSEQIAPTTTHDHGLGPGCPPRSRDMRGMTGLAAARAGGSGRRYRSRRVPAPLPGQSPARSERS